MIKGEILFIDKATNEDDVYPIKKIVESKPMSALCKSFMKEDLMQLQEKAIVNENCDQIISIVYFIFQYNIAQLIFHELNYENLFIISLKIVDGQNKQTTCKTINAIPNKY